MYLHLWQLLKTDKRKTLKRPFEDCLKRLICNVNVPLARALGAVCLWHLTNLHHKPPSQLPFTTGTILQQLLMRPFPMCHWQLVYHKLPSVSLTTIGHSLEEVFKRTIWRVLEDHLTTVCRETYLQCAFGNYCRALEAMCLWQHLHHKLPSQLPFTSNKCAFSDCL